MSDPKLPAEQLIQEAQYDYPDHYIPCIDDEHISQLQYWPWGMHYPSGKWVILNQLDSWAFDSLIDVGCGDGRFLRELAAERLSVDTLDIDYSEQFIAMARGMNPDLDYEVLNLLSSDFSREFDVATAVEVLEHIPPDNLPTFVSSITDVLADDGLLVLILPHENKPVQNKHYQHFSPADLESLSRPHFNTVEFALFDKQSKVFTALELALGGRGHHFVVNFLPVVDTLWKLYQRRYLYADSESNCRPIVAVCQR